MMAGRISVEQFQFLTQDATLEKQIKAQGIYKMEGTMLSEKCHAARRQQSPVKAVAKGLRGPASASVNPFRAQAEHSAARIETPGSKV